MILETLGEWHLRWQGNLLTLLELFGSAARQLETQLVFDYKSVRDSKALGNQDVLWDPIDNSRANANLLKGLENDISCI
jgi:hypothetical protein